jgi:superfamily II DNA or RNA helicase
MWLPCQERRSSREERRRLVSDEKKAKIVIGNKYSRIVADLPQAVILELRRAMSFRVKGCEFMPSFIDGKWDGMISLLEPEFVFMTGLMSIARTTLTSYGYGISYVDKRVVPEKNFKELKFTPPSGFEYEKREYQTAAVNRSIQFTRGIIQVGTGGGKTLLVTELIASLKVKPFIYFVMSHDLLEQAVETLSAFLGIEIGVIGDGKCIIRDVTVCMVQTAVMCLHADDKSFDVKKHKIDSDTVWDDDEVFIMNNADKIRKFISECVGLYFDEVHHAAAETCKDVIFAADSAYYKFGGSATPVREDGKELVINGLFGTKIVDISITYLTEHGYLVPGWVFFTRVDLGVGGDADDNYGKRYESAVVDNDQFNATVVDIAQFLAANNVLCLLLVQRIKHGKALQKMIPGSEFLSGKDTRKRRSAVIQSMRDSKLKILIATTLADEGLDIKPLQAVFMLSAGSSVTRIPQRIGRCIRKYKSKKYGMFLYFRHTVSNLFEQGTKVRKLIEQEPCLKIIDVRRLDKLKSAICDFINKQGLIEW